jgi:hypothetical protein
MAQTASIVSFKAAKSQAPIALGSMEIEVVN